MSGASHCHGNARREGFFAPLKSKKLCRMNTAKLRREDVQTVICQHIYYGSLRRISSVTGGFPLLIYRRNY